MPRRHPPDQAPAGNVYGGAWEGPLVILTHHPEHAQPADGVTFLRCDVAEAVRIGPEVAGGKNFEVFSPTIARQLIERGLIDGSAQTAMARDRHPMARAAAAGRQGRRLRLLSNR